MAGVSAPQRERGREHRPPIARRKPALGKLTKFAYTFSAKTGIKTLPRKGFVKNDLFRISLAGELPRDEHATGQGVFHQTPGQRHRPAEGSPGKASERIEPTGSHARLFDQRNTAVNASRGLPEPLDGNKARYWLSGCFVQSKARKRQSKRQNLSTAVDKSALWAISKPVHASF